MPCQILKLAESTHTMEHHKPKVHENESKKLKMGRPLVMPVEERYREIFNTAEQLFGEKGFANVTMAEIAVAVGMSKKTLYVYFSDKRELLKSLVSSSYLWSEQPKKLNVDISAIDALKQHLYMIASYVLSERHLKLCRLAIAENYGSEGMSDTFYQLGVANSRQSLIESIGRIPNEQRILSLSDELLADMVFGAVIGKLMIDALMAKTDQLSNFTEIDLKIAEVVDVMFKS